MGCTNSSQVSDVRKVIDKTVSTTVEPKMENENVQSNVDNDVIKIMLLGSAESGKTTIFEQIRNLYTHDYTKFEFIHRKAFIFENIINSMNSLISFMRSSGLKFANAENELNAKLIFCEESNGEQHFSDEQIKALKDLWTDATIQTIYNRRAEFNLNDSVQYFFDSLDRINSTNFEPNPQDLIMAYCPTTGVQQLDFSVGNQKYQLFDVGGKKIDRKKWSTMYDDINAVIFCLAISEYNQTMDEDGTTNRLIDALQLLEHVCKEEKLQSAILFVFLNEIDVFAEKFNAASFIECLPQYNGSSDIEEAKIFLAEYILDKCLPHMHSIRLEFTCAIDMDFMKSVLESVFKTIAQK